MRWRLHPQRLAAQCFVGPRRKALSDHYTDYTARKLSSEYYDKKTYPAVGSHSQRRHRSTHGRQLGASPSRSWRTKEERYQQKMKKKTHPLTHSRGRSRSAKGGSRGVRGASGAVAHGIRDRWQRSQRASFEAKRCREATRKSFTRPILAAFHSIKPEPSCAFKKF